MGFHLRMSFTGLCLFVPSRDGTILNVVLPDPHKALGLDPHFANIFYDQAYETGTGDLTNSFNSIPLLKQNVSLSPAAAGPAGAITPATFAPALVPNVTTAALQAHPHQPGEPADKGKVRPEVLSAAHDWVTSALTIEGGRLLGYSASGPWSFQSPIDTFLAWKLEWVIDDVQAATIQVTTTDTKGGTKTKSLRPVKNVVELRVKNVPKAESMAEDPPYDPGMMPGMRHFQAFYQMLLDIPDGPEPKPAHKGTLITCTPAVGQL